MLTRSEMCLVFTVALPQAERQELSAGLESALRRIVEDARRQQWLAGSNEALRLLGLNMGMFAGSESMLDGSFALLDEDLA